MPPLPHIDESLKEIEYAFDTLRVDGVGIMTSYGDKWLGYQEFEPVWQELNKREATVYTHPTGANFCVNLVRNVDEAFIEYGTDTTRFHLHDDLLALCREISRHKVDLVARWRLDNGILRALYSAGANMTTLQGQIHT